MVEIVTLTKHDLETLIQDTVRATVSKFTKPVPPIMNKSQVAEYLGKSTATIDRYMRDEKMPPQKNKPKKPNER